MSKDTTGYFIWHELMTTDPKAAISFYSQVIGWTTQAWGEGAADGSSGGYVMWANAEGPLGGVMQLPAEACEKGAKPHWLCNVKVKDIHASAAKAKALGGNVLKGPEPIPSVGHFAVIADPQGAIICIYQPDGDSDLKDRNKPGAFMWSELVTDDPAAAFDFYQGLFHFEKISEMDMGPMGLYRIFGRNGEDLGGIMARPQEMPFPNAWLYYTTVENLDGSIETAVKLGGQLMNGPMPIPGGARIAQLLDPQGAMFAIIGQ